MEASGPCSHNHSDVVVQRTSSVVEVRRACATRCMRRSCAMSGATHRSLGRLERSRSHSREETKCRYASELDGQVSRVHGAAVPLQPEAKRLQPYPEFRQRIGPKIVPLLPHAVAPFASHRYIPPTQTLLWVLSGSLNQRVEKAVDPMSTVFDFATSPLDVQRDGHCRRTGSGSSFGGLSTPPVHSSGAWNNTQRNW